MASWGSKFVWLSLIYVAGKKLFLTAILTYAACYLGGFCIGMPDWILVNNSIASTQVVS